MLVPSLFTDNFVNEFFNSAFGNDRTPSMFHATGSSIITQAANSATLGLASKLFGVDVIGVVAPEAAAETEQAPEAAAKTVTEAPHDEIA